MSVNLLTHIGKPVEISDELESFFHVLVYYAVRHLRSSCPDIGDWIYHYFERYAGPERMLACGQKSYTVEVSGVLEVRVPQRRLVFHSPMDDALAPVLERLQAHYAVMEYEAAKAATPPPRPKTPPAPCSDLSTIWILAKHADLEDEPEEDEGGRADSEGCRANKGPSAETRKLAKQVADHKFMLSHLSRVLRDRRWVYGDRISATDDSRCSSTDIGGKGSEDASPRSAKRQRISGPERNVSLPPRLHPSGLRAQARARTHPLRLRR